ncbi:hypothetical protein VCR4J5_200120 [Vibrio crassostreae]|uniref:Uncharacterized protein n=1 Tax=Vibrio crassostreae TaxID=246167 RepID=A0ABP1WVU2_9VIBR|nr:hypothetical protein VCR4J5_200120 [Vibrio crassostreae]CDT49419.1 hypothetical protein VCR19J5_560120 [Vibrio crassostreae]
MVTHRNADSLTIGVQFRSNLMDSGNFIQKNPIKNNLYRIF